MSATQCGECGAICASNEDFYAHSDREHPGAAKVQGLSMSTVDQMKGLGLDAEALKVGMRGLPGETDDAFRERIRPAIERRAETIVSVMREITALNDDELAVVHGVIEGLVRGRKQYGPLVVDSDERDWAAECFAEQRDAAIYACIGLIKAKRAKR